MMAWLLSGRYGRLGNENHSVRSGKVRKSLRKLLKIAWKGVCCAALLWILAFVIAPDQPIKSADMWSKIGVYFTGLMILPPFIVLFLLLELWLGATASPSDQSRMEE